MEGNMPKGKQKPVDWHIFSLLTENDLYLCNEGSHFRIYEKLGAHPLTVDNQEGTFFAVWAPNAKTVSVIGNFNDWITNKDYLQSYGKSGIWGGFIPGVTNGALYKYHITARTDDYITDRADPIAFYSEIPPKTASVVWNLDYQWGDMKFISARGDASKKRATGH